MRSRRLVGGAAAIGIVAALSATTAAHAQPSYPVQPPTAAVSATTVPAGGAITLTGSNWLPNSTVTVTVSPGLPAGTAMVPAAAEAPAAAAPRTGAVTTRGEADDTDGMDGTDDVDGDDARGYGGDGGPPQVLAVRVDAAGGFTVTLTLRHPGYNTITVSGIDASGTPAARQVVVCVLGRPHHHRHHRHHHHRYHHGGPPFGEEGGSFYGHYGEGPQGAAAHAGGRHLAYTGAPVRGASLAGLGLLTLGTALAVVARRRRVTASD